MRNAISKTQRESNHPHPRATARRITAGIFAFVGLLGFSAQAQDWQVLNRQEGSWETFASSAEGSTLILAGGTGAAIKISTNSGADWSFSSPTATNHWVSVASAADGSRLYLASYNYPALGPIAVSTNGGATWAPTGAPLEDWSDTRGSIATSGDGQNVVAATGYGSANGGSIFASTNGGSSWIQASAPTQFWSGVACSADGTKMAAVSANRDPSSPAGGIFISTNSGSSWTRTSAPTNNWSSVASSADGTKLVAAYGNNVPRLAGSGAIYISTNSGTSWTPSSAPSMNWLQVVSSADGSILAGLTGAPSDGLTSLWISTNSGFSWTVDWTPLSSEVPFAMTIMAGGHRLVATAGPTVYVQTTVAGQASAAAGGKFSLSWSAQVGQSYQVQFSADLSQTNWTDLGAAVTATNGILPVSDPIGANADRFYRAVLQK